MKKCILILQFNKSPARHTLPAPEEMRNTPGRKWWLQRRCWEVRGLWGWNTCLWGHGPHQAFTKVWKLHPSLQSQGRSVTIPATHCLAARRGRDGPTFRFWSGIIHCHLPCSSWDTDPFPALPALLSLLWGIQQPRAPPPCSSPQLTENIWPWLCTSVGSWLLFFQPDICLDIGITVPQTDCRWKENPHENLTENRQTDDCVVWYIYIFHFSWCSF